MEIKQAQLPLAMPATTMDDDAGKAARNSATAQEAPVTVSADGSEAMQEALLNAARDMHDAQSARCQVHEEANAQAKRALGLDGGGVDGGKLDALQEALAAAALSEKLDGGREKAAAETFLNLLRNAADGKAAADAGGADNDGDGDTPAISPYAARSMPSPYSASDNGSKSGNNLGDIWKELAEMIGKSEKGDVADYGAALDQYTKLYQAISDILAKFGTWVRADDDNYMRVDFAALKQALTELLNKYENPTQDQVIAGKAPTGGIKEDEAKAICEKLGLDPKECCHKNGDGTYCVIPDMSQIKKMIAGLPASSDNHKISIASYNAWKAGFDSQMSRIEDSLQTRGQKYSNTYSRFENFHKTISSIIQSMADMLRQFLQF